MRTRFSIRTVLLALGLAAVTAPASAQGKFVGVDDDPSMGSPSAKVTIIEFGDYQCPACRAFWRDTEPQIKKAYIDTGKVRLVYRDFPLEQVHPEAVLGAMAAQCAHDQGKYWEMHDRIFREQDARGQGMVRYSAADLKSWAGAIGLDAAAFGSCLDSQKHKAEVAKDQADGLDVGVRGTPTFFINGRVIGGPQPFAAFQQVIDQLLAQ